MTRVGRELGTDGKLGGQAIVPGVAGTWKDLTELGERNVWKSDGSGPNIAQVARCCSPVEIFPKITVDVRGEILELKNTINTMVDQLNSFASEVTRVAREVGTKESRRPGRASGVAGTWKDLTDSVNFMASNFCRSSAQHRTSTAIAGGDLSKQNYAERRDFAAQGNHQHDGGPTECICRRGDARGARGGHRGTTWRAGRCCRHLEDLTDGANSMASNLTAQVADCRSIDAIASGDLSKKITVDVRGILELKDTINTMVDQLNAFAGSYVLPERWEPRVKGVAGTWKDLTDRRRQSMASNLTGQVAILPRSRQPWHSGTFPRRLRWTSVVRFSS